MTMAEPPDAQRRLRGLAWHFGAYLVVIAILAAVDFAFFPERVWVIFPAVLWGAPLSLHTAFAMGLFDIFRKDRR